MRYRTDERGEEIQADLGRQTQEMIDALLAECGPQPIDGWKDEDREWARRKIEGTLHEVVYRQGVGFVPEGSLTDDEVRQIRRDAYDPLTGEYS